MSEQGNVFLQRMERQRKLLSMLLLTTLILIGWAYFPTYASIVAKWDSDATFSHGYLILPVTLWLIWRLRHEIASTPFCPSAAGVVAVGACVLAWIVAKAAGVLVVEQFAAVAMIPSLVLAALGGPVTRVLVFPLAFLLFMVPIGRGLVPFLMQATAAAAALLVEWTGIPVLRSYMYLTIPFGQFEVARACSGLNYFVTSLVLGVLYAYLNYVDWKKRLLCVAAFLVFPVVLNILRVYIIVVVSYLTEFRFGPGQEHVVFGRAFFVVVILGMFWLGRRWHDDSNAGPTTSNGATPQSGISGLARWWPLPVACAVALSGPPFVSTSVTSARLKLAHPAALVKFVQAPDGWHGPVDGAGRWRPHFMGGLVEQQAIYKQSDGRGVDVFVSVYGLGSTLGAEMISYNNVVTGSERGSLAKDVTRKLQFGDGSLLRVRELVVQDEAGQRLVWHWYVVGERAVISPYATKVLEALAFVTRSADSERVVTVSTPLDSGAEQRLKAFVTSAGRCAALGFSGEACGG